jgi:hypothetical protein
MLDIDLKVRHKHLIRIQCIFVTVHNGKVHQHLY